MTGQGQHEKTHLKPLLTINLRNKSFHNSMECLGLYLKVNIPPWLENFQIYSVQNTEKCICETPPAWHDLISRPPM